MALDDLAVLIGKLGPGDYELRLEGGETVDAVLDDVEVSEERGFHAEGRDEPGDVVYELTTGDQPGGPIQVRRRELDEDEWRTLGELADVSKQG